MVSVNLQLQPVRIESHPTQGTLEFVDQVGILKLPHREVYAHHYPGTVVVLVAPLPSLAEWLGWPTERVSRWMSARPEPVVIGWPYDDTRRWYIAYRCRNPNTIDYLIYG
jgi:hypothetical protein